MCLVVGVGLFGLGCGVLGVFVGLFVLFCFVVDWWFWGGGGSWYFLLWGGG